MNLIEVLKNNGTGLLEGLCRLGDENSNFLLLISDLKLDLKKNNSVDEKVKVTFSLNERNLGTFEIHIYEVKNENIQAEITDNENIVVCWLNIFWSDDEFFTRFQAIMMN